MAEGFNFEDFSQDEDKKLKLYDADSKPVEFTKTESVEAAVVRKKSANYKRKERDLLVQKRVPSTNT